MAYLKAILAGLFASAITYLCFLTWIHMKATEAAEERGTEGLIGVAGSQAYVLHSPARTSAFPGEGFEHPELDARIPAVV